MGTISNVLHYAYENKWTIGFVERSIQDIINNGMGEVRWLQHCYKDRWFADPFILDVTDDYIQVLVEEYYDGIKRGRIARLDINRRTMQLEANVTLLQLDTHLSFPAISRKGGMVYIYPENSATGGLDLYEYDVKESSCKRVRRICEEPLTDAVMSDLFGKEQIFSTHIPTQNGDVLTVYEKQADMFVAQQDIRFESNIARNAGDWFREGGKVFRPAQDCNNSYGGAMILQEVVKNEDGSYGFTDLRRIESSNKEYHTGCHTFNYYKGVGVIDVHGQRRPMMAAVFDALKAEKITNSLYHLIKGKRNG